MSLGKANRRKLNSILVGSGLIIGIGDWVEKERKKKSIVKSSVINSFIAEKSQVGRNEIFE